MKLKPEYKTRWLEALRSGAYKQTRDQLRDEVGFCCLGVLCDVVKNDLGKDWENRGNEPYSYLYSFGGDAGTLPHCVQELVFEPLDDEPDLRCNPDVEVALPEYKCTQLRGLTVLNDEEHYTFEQIANLIEAQL